MKLRDIAFLALGTLVAAVPAAGSAAQRVAGTVRDPVGNALSGVEILILSLDAIAPVAMATSDEGGGFDIGALVPGTYRYAALKDGYGTFLGRFDTATRKSLDLVLRPIRDGAEETAAPSDSSSWALRVPRRGILHDRRSPAAEAGEPPAAADSLRVRVDQLFAGSAEGRASAGGGVHASETSMAVDSSFGDRGDLRVASRVTRAGSEGTGIDATHASQDDDGMTIGMSYAPEPSARVEVGAHYGRQDLEIDGAGAPALLHERRSWGYTASYSKRIDRAHELEVGLDYGDTAFATTEDAPALVSRTATASGRFSRVHGESHVLTAALRAALAPTFDSGLAPWASDWTVELDLGDEWAVAGPLSVRSGLDCRRGLGSSPLSVLVPNVGARWSDERLDLEGRVSWHAVGAETTRGEVGFGTSLEYRLTDGLALAAAAEHQPFLYGTDGGLGSAGEGEGFPVWVNGGDAARSHARLGLIESRGYTRSFFEVAGGRVQGRVTPLLVFGSSPESGAQQALSYSDVRVGVAVPSVGTEVSVAYHWILSTSEGASADEESDRQESVDLRVIQELARIGVPGQWRLLVALRMASTESQSLEDWADQGGDEEVLAALERRVGAGVSVVF